ncbi:MAG: hypothetical protein EOO20_18305 [Chryseobacterium sp.]|nr:MAG: hypothetical protein EOO20_18305 [Chryseobacterium sp.]
MQHLSFNPKSFLRSGSRKSASSCDALSPKKQDPSWFTRKYIGFELTDEIFKEVDSIGSEKYVILDFLGKSHLVPKDLYDIVEEINDSKYILELQDNWDHCGAKAANIEVYKKSIEFLLMYSQHIYNVYGVIIQAPEINLIPSGTIDFSWRTSGARMLINFKQKDDKILATWFGYHKPDNLPEEGYIDVTKINESKAVWMKELK